MSMNELEVQVNELRELRRMAEELNSEISALRNNMKETTQRKPLFDIVSGLEELLISANRSADLMEILDEGLTEEIEGAAKDDPVFRHLSDRYSMFHSLMETVEYQLNEAIQVADNTFQLTKRLFQEAQQIA